MTQLQTARAGRISPEMAAAAEAENISPEALRELIAQGHAALPANTNRTPARPYAIGRNLRTKVNANIGTSSACASMDMEIRKLQAAVEAGADSVMDLSTGGDLDAIRTRILEASPVMVGGVPIYGLAASVLARGGAITDIEPDDLLADIERQCLAGLDYITVHCGVIQQVVDRLEHHPRLMPSVSRGGSILMDWMKRRGEDNPLYTRFDDLLEICLASDVTLSLGDGFRPGTVLDSNDSAQFQELVILGELASRARRVGVQVIIEGPGHVPLDRIATNVQLEKDLCDGAPFYLLGPLVTDVAPGYDHISAAIGGAMAAGLGADFLCYVTPAEHLSLPDEEDVRQGVIASRIAGHAADIAKKLPGAMAWDKRMSEARRDLDWEGMAREAIDPGAVTTRHQPVPENRACSMCGELCAVKIHHPD